MAENVSNLLRAIGAYVDQSSDLPTDDELVSRISYLDMAQREWAGSYDWDVLRHTSGITGSGASVGLDSTFKKLRTAVHDVTGDYIYNEIDPADRFTKGSTDKYVYILGNAIDGKYLTINPAADPSAASLLFDWVSFPTSLVTLQDTTACPNPEFLIKRAIGFILESRSDTRFPSVKADADRLLNNMIADQDTGSGGKVNRIPTFLDSVYVIGE